ncbi:Histone deacetylase [Arachis hypogaea]|nr:Histone deacetylase [Arachis hypogaea]
MVNSYPNVQGFTVIRNGGEDFVQSMVVVMESTISKVVKTYQPGAIVLQCGADSFAGDRPDCFNLSLDGAYLPVMLNVSNS